MMIDEALPKALYRTHKVSFENITSICYTLLKHAKSDEEEK
jgi:hypothetical protein